jgi:2-hydroxychromene-2-carboxylate isomerase
VHDVIFYLDFISPYTWLALTQARTFGERHDVRWELRPVVYAALLDAHGLVGPVETPAKRRYTIRDVARSASALGLRLVGPPEHPFRSIEALRALTLFRDDPLALGLAVGLADAAWGEGRSLTDAAVLEDVVTSVGLDADRLAERIAATGIKEALRRSTEEALDRGVFGVPTFVYDDELFWGHDRMEQLARRIAERQPKP